MNHTPWTFQLKYLDSNTVVPGNLFSVALEKYSICFLGYYQASDLYVVPDNIKLVEESVLKRYQSKGKRWKIIKHKGLDS